jgi:hypothetical protein
MAGKKLNKVLGFVYILLATIGFITICMHVQIDLISSTKYNFIGKWFLIICIMFTQGFIIYHNSKKL